MPLGRIAARHDPGMLLEIVAGPSFGDQRLGMGGSWLGLGLVVKQMFSYPDFPSFETILLVEFRGSHWRRRP